MKKWINTLINFALGPIAVGLGLWFFLLSRNSFIAFMGIVYVRGDHARSVQVRVLEKFFFIFVGLIFVVLALAVFEYTRTNAGKISRPGKPSYAIRMLFVIGIELLLIFAADLVWLWAQHFNSSLLRWVLLVGELILGTGLTIYSYIILRKLRIRFISISPQVGGPW